MRAVTSYISSYIYVWINLHLHTTHVHIRVLPWFRFREKKKRKIKKNLSLRPFDLWPRDCGCEPENVTSHIHIYICECVFPHMCTLYTHDRLSCEDFSNSGKRLFVLTISAAISDNKMSYAIKIIKFKCLLVFLTPHMNNYSPNLFLDTQQIVCMHAFFFC